MATTAKSNTAKSSTKKTASGTTKVAPKTVSKTTTKSPAKTATKTVAPKAKSSTVKSNVATPQTRKSSTKPNIALFIDVDNVGVSRENLLEILFFVSGKFNVNLCKLYGFSEDTLPGIKEVASDYNLVTVGKMKFKTAGQNCLDSRILVDAYECAVKNAKTLDTIFVWCYPCDLAECFEKIVEQGVATATIDNRAFDCKNKFVSQVFKLYSPYAFDGDNQMYGQIQNSPTPMPSVTNAEPESTPLPKPTMESTPGVTPAAEDSTKNNDTIETLDDKPIPVLPRREIVERSTKPTPKTDAAVDTAVTGIDPNENIVDAISRKLNITRPNLEQFEQEMEQRKAENADTVSLLDVIKKAGFIDDDANKKPKKYEDTIGDL